ncbi:MAG: BMP family ABC transporter substrate-binding protein [Clostridia bacterium]|nr:BMP family ABC transporter substrate-binding protein [Clostridia bacterium]
MKRYYVMTVLTALALLLVFSLIYSVWDESPSQDSITVGFLYSEDESVPNTYNFSLAQSALESAYGDQVHILVRNNVPKTGMEDPARELIKKGCAILFTNSDSEQLIDLARNYPDVQICQVSNSAAKEKGERPDNYHTFNGRINEVRYVSGVAAGLKLQSMIENGEAEKENVRIGFVCDYANSEALSDATAFLLGIRSVVSDASMLIRCTSKGGGYHREMECAAQLIEEGCVVISQYSETYGPAVACEAAAANKKVIHVGCHQSMIDLAPTTSLISVRVNWTPYVTGAVKAVMNRKSIESTVSGRVYGGNDMSGGFDVDWVQVLELNRHLATEGMEARINKLIDSFKKGNVDVFRGNYTGVDPFNSSLSIDLTQGFTENKSASYPTFHYLLQGVMTIE